MVVAPSAPLTQRSVRSHTPLVLLSLAYGVVLLASWAPDTLALMMPGSLEEGLKGVRACVRACARVFAVTSTLVVGGGVPAQCACGLAERQHMACWYHLPP
jgi:hypothetical protein